MLMYNLKGGLMSKTITAYLICGSLITVLLPCHALQNATTCYSVCTCSDNGRHVDCSDRHLLRLPNVTGATTVHLLLNGNQISEVDNDGFIGLNNLVVLRLDNNVLHVMPNFEELQNLEKLDISMNRIRRIPDNGFRSNLKLRHLRLDHNPITFIGDRALANLPHLQHLKLSGADFGHKFPNMSGNVNLETLGLDRGHLKELPQDLCSSYPALELLDVHANHIESVPVFGHCNFLNVINLSMNKISHLPPLAFSELRNLKDLLLNHNSIERITDTAFRGLVHLVFLDLQHNKLTDIHPKAFISMANLQEININNNRLRDLPASGLRHVKHIRAHANPQMRSFPQPHAFPFVQTLHLAYAYHCCPYMALGDSQVDKDLTENITFVESASYTLGDDQSNASSGADLAEAWLGSPLDRVWRIPSAAHKRVVCTPAPGPFYPCQDLMGWWATRCGVWVVCLLALIGNATVLVVSMVTGKIHVPRFLVCNLAVADLLMGLYLVILALVDAATFGEFRSHAVTWQQSGWCLLTGFLGVFSSELSVFTLAVITIERYFAITHPMKVEERLTIKHAGCFMALGWVFSFVMALLPLLGVSDYRKSALCLPFETEDGRSMGYVMFLLLFNLFAFAVICGCYAHVFRSVRSSSLWGSRDGRVARRMAVLVFTDLVCWLPVCALGLAAVYGSSLISLDQAKFVLVFILPLNACCNPFMYALLTKQFQRDCRAVCSRLDESIHGGTDEGGHGNIGFRVRSFFRSRDSFRSHRTASSSHSQHSFRTMTSSLSWDRSSLLSSIKDYFRKPGDFGVGHDIAEGGREMGLSDVANEALSMDGTPRCHGGRRESRPREAVELENNMNNLNCEHEESNEFLRMDSATKGTYPELNVDESCDAELLRTNTIMEDKF